MGGWGIDGWGDVGGWGDDVDSVADVIPEYDDLNSNNPKKIAIIGRNMIPWYILNEWCIMKSQIFLVYSFTAYVIKKAWLIKV